MRGQASRQRTATRPARKMCKPLLDKLATRSLKSALLMLVRHGHLAEHDAATIREDLSDPLPAIVGLLNRERIHHTVAQCLIDIDEAERERRARDNARNPVTRTLYSFVPYEERDTEGAVPDEANSSIEGEILPHDFAGDTYSRHDETPTTALGGWEVPLPSPFVNPEDELVQSENAAELASLYANYHSALLALPDWWRRFWHLHHNDGVDQCEIAQAEGISAVMVHKIIKKATGRISAGVNFARFFQLLCEKRHPATESPKPPARPHYSGRWPWEMATQSYVGSYDKRGWRPKYRNLLPAYLLLCFGHEVAIPDGCRIYRRGPLRKYVLPPTDSPLFGGLVSPPIRPHDSKGGEAE